MIEPLPIRKPYWFDRQPTAAKKMQCLMEYNFKPRCQMADFRGMGFFDLDSTCWFDGFPSDDLMLLRCVYVLPQYRRQGVQTAILETLRSMSRMSGCGLLAITHTFELSGKLPETAEEFTETWCRNPSENYRDTDSVENRKQNQAFRKQGWVNVNVEETISAYRRYFITPKWCWLLKPDTASKRLSLFYAKTSCENRYP